MPVARSFLGFGFIVLLAIFFLGVFLIVAFLVGLAFFLGIGLLVGLVFLLSIGLLVSLVFLLRVSFLVRLVFFLRVGFLVGLVFLLRVGGLLVVDLGRLLGVFLGFGFLSRGFVLLDRKSTRLNSSHVSQSRMPSSA